MRLVYVLLLTISTEQGIALIKRFISLYCFILIIVSVCIFYSTLKESVFMLFSVLIPMYNVEKYVLQCIESIENQSFTDYEVIIVDDGSTDSTSELLDIAKSQYKNITVLHKKNGGVTSARKAAAIAARGEYVFILDGDDYIDSNCLNLFAAVINNYHPEIVISGYKRELPDGRYKEKKAIPVNLCGLYTNNDLDNTVRSNIFLVSRTLWAKAIKRELYTTIQMELDDTITMGDDACIIYPLLCNANSIYFLNEYPYYYRYNDESMTKSKKKYIAWESCLDRICFFEDHLPLDKANMPEQFSKYVIYVCFSAVITQIRKDRFFAVKKKAIRVLASERIDYYLRLKGINFSRSEKLMKFLLKYRLFFIIKILSMIK